MSSLDSSAFAAKFPRLRGLAKCVRDYRYGSPLSHPTARKTGEATKRLPFSVVRKTRRLMATAIVELEAALS